MDKSISNCQFDFFVKPFAQAGTAQNLGLEVRIYQAFELIKPLDLIQSIVEAKAIVTQRQFF